MPATAEKNQTVADIIVRQLDTWGVKFVYGIPGETELAIVDAIGEARTSSSYSCGMNK